MAIGLVSGATCRRTGPEERAGPSVVSLARSLVSECPVAAPGGSERMVFRVDRRLLALRSSAGNVGVAIGLVSGATCRRTGPEERAGPSVVSLVRSLVSVCPEPAPDGSERMVVRVGLRLWPVSYTHMTVATNWEGEVVGCAGCGEK